MPAPIQFARTADGATIAYAEEGNGPQVVFVRGWITHLELQPDSEAYSSFFETMHPDFRVVRYDGRGNGLSDRELPDPVELDHLVLDVEAVIDALDPSPVILWGSSFGGPAAIGYAARHPEKVSSLILDGTYACGPNLADREQQEAFTAMLQLARVQPDGLFAALSFLTDPEPGAGHEARVDRMRHSISPEAVIALYTALYEFDVEELLPAIDVPTLVLHRRGSRSIPFDRGRELAAGIRGARFVGLEGRAHNLWEEHPREALSALGSFLGVGDAFAKRLAPRASVDEAMPMAVLFTDIVGSTGFTARLGDHEAHEVVRHHNNIVREALAETRGREIKHTGDGIMASFPAVSAALACAARIQAAVAGAVTADHGEALVVRMGINAGEPLSEDDDLFGTVVQLAARVCDRAEPGQVLVTNLVRELASGKGFEFRDCGSSDLKGFDEPVHLWELAPRP
jgi:pimeloyl-ACP methyl ester carboxylesterase